MELNELKFNIANNFSFASNSYDEYSQIQKKCAHKLVGLIKSKYSSFIPRSILDLGTGTGNVPKLLINRFPKAHFLLNDIAPNMLSVAKAHFNDNTNIDYLLADMESYDFGFHDLTTSNLAFQWVGDLNETVSKLFQNSQVLAFSCLLDSTFSKWTDMHNNLAIRAPTFMYPSQQMIEDQLLKLLPKKHHFGTEEYSLEFNNAINFVYYLKGLGANTSSIKSNPINLRKILKTYTQKFNITYKVFFAILSK